MHMHLHQWILGDRLKRICRKLISPKNFHELNLCEILLQLICLPGTLQAYNTLVFCFPFYTPVSRRAELCDWVWRAGVWAGVHTGFRTITLVLYIYFGVIRSKVKVTVTINIIFDNRVVSAR